MCIHKTKGFCPPSVYSFRKCESSVSTLVESTLAFLHIVAGQPYVGPLHSPTPVGSGWFKALSTLLQPHTMGPQQWFLQLHLHPEPL